MRKSLITLGLASVIGTSSFLIPFTSKTASAETLDEKKQKIESKQSEVASSIEAKEKELTELQENQSKIEKELKDINDKALDTSNKIEDKKEENDKTKEEIKKLKKEIKETEARIEKRNEILKKRVRSLQESGGSQGYIDVLLGSTSFGDFISRATAVSSIVDADKDLIKQQEQDKAKLEDSEADLNDKLKEVQAALAKLETMQKDLDKQLNEKDKLFDEAKASQKKTAKAISELKSEASELANQKANTEAEQARIKKEQEAAAALIKKQEEAQKASDETQTDDSQTATTESAKASSSDDSSDNSSNGSSNSSSNGSSSKKSSGSNSNSGGTVISNSGGIEGAISVGSSIVGQSPYKFGGGRSQSDINNRIFDCSSFVRWAYASAGVNLGPVGGTTTDTLVGRGQAVSASEMKRGDLVFFDTYKTNGHVGIYLGNGTFLNDNTSHGVSVDSMSNPYWKAAFKGVVRRVVQ
ncbi:peptidoglycan DL-endopeptidase CwlO [Bacillus subtilis]|uniref:peptidoglycan DL-endopeptidase CwlO n=1 Tax=Bacillus subtilis TaxID=1423 RepID=UPI000FFE2943|nr:peptidoglycan DL-endopeptidase CwlO [Bacillus subtilis]NCT23081.1 peptidoglycan DL-endopeptidase CwlO [Bacillus subtilis subsp. subtilis]MEC2400085.1 peptidoglycan DL-endopeptidase CwlO [Bacillus subtilis]MEC3650094.1 peptidoglycan DL-endopeptidase CwlO [Bacillus subtilis]MED0588290.1 peptidoglycan DL-endopeptidase CwlO [Bacillus subtilis]MED4661626.1 peptidoglycan DL-endopeptidase CwlO [Bacillus subtilis]